MQRHPPLQLLHPRCNPHPRFRQHVGSLLDIAQYYVVRHFRNTRGGAAFLPALYDVAVSHLLRPRNRGLPSALLSFPMRNQRIRNWHVILFGDGAGQPHAKHSFQRQGVGGDAGEHCFGKRVQLRFRLRGTGELTALL